MKMKKLIKKGHYENMGCLVPITEPKNILEQYAMTETLYGEKLPVITRNMVHKLNKSDKKAYKSLPQKLTIYRGCHKDEVNNPRCQSWTLSKDIARHFAWVHYVDHEQFSYEDMHDRVVLKATIHKKDIYAYLDEIRGEKECIVNLDGLKNIEIIEEFDISMAEDAYNKNLVGSVKRTYMMGKRGVQGFKSFDQNIVFMDIVDFLVLAKKDSSLSFLDRKTA